VKSAAASVGSWPPRLQHTDPIRAAYERADGDGAELVDRDDVALARADLGTSRWSDRVAAALDYFARY
jgi:hypothetical protein